MTTADEIARMLFKAMEVSKDYSYDFISEHGLPEAGGGDWEYDGMDEKYRQNKPNQSSFSFTFTNYTTVSVTVEVLGDLRP